MVHLQIDGGRLGVVNDVARDARSLIAPVHPDSERPISLVIDAADQVAADHRVDRFVDLDGGRLPAAELLAVIGVFDEVSFDEAARRPLLTGDARLAATADHVVADDVGAEGLDVVVVHALRLAENYAHATGIGDGAVLDNPRLAHPRPDRSHLHLEAGRLPVSAECMM